MPLLRNKKKLDYTNYVKTTSPAWYYPLTETAAGTMSDVSGSPAQTLTAGADADFVGSGIGRKLGAGIFHTAASQTYDNAGLAAVALAESTTADNDLYNYFKDATSSAPLTITGWFYTKTWAGGNADGFLLSFGNTFYLHRKQGATSAVTVMFRDVGGARTQDVTVLDNAWNFLAIHVYPTAGDDTQDTSVSVNGAAFITDLTVVKTYNGSPQLGGTHKLGVLFRETDWKSGCGGVAHLAFYKRLLTITEVQNLYNYGVNG